MKTLSIITIALAACVLSACGGKGSSAAAGGDSTAMTLQKNEQTAWKTMVAFQNKNADSIYKACSADFVDYGTGEDKPVKNVDSLKASLKGLWAAFPDMTGHDLRIEGKGDTVIIWGTWTGTFKGAMGPVKPTGKSFKLIDADIFSFNKQGQITSHGSIQSMNTYFNQAGIKM